MNDDAILFHLHKDEGKRTDLADTMFSRYMEEIKPMEESLGGRGGERSRERAEETNDKECFRRGRVKVRC